MRPWKTIYLQNTTKITLHVSQTGIISFCYEGPTWRLILQWEIYYSLSRKMWQCWWNCVTLKWSVLIWSEQHHLLKVLQVARWCKVGERDSQQMVSPLRKNPPFDLRTVLLLPTNLVPQVPVGCAGPPPAPASGPTFEIMKVIIMSLSLLLPGRREVKLPMESSHQHIPRAARGFIIRKAPLVPLQSATNIVLKLKFITSLLQLWSYCCSFGHHFNWLR